ncbi:hypothetical protein L0222_15210 [bacterium]|nr:hypothetical protein [bacterium]MCI0604239.1 hypothetical protein [bacterium]
MKIRILLFLVLSIAATSPVFPVLKPHYGGNAKISEDLSPGLLQVRVFENQKDLLRTSFPLPFAINENTLRMDLSAWPADKITELEKAIVSLRDQTNPCHWILDYPYFHHDHPNSLEIEKDHLVLKTEEPEHLIPLAQSPCLIPQRISYLLPFSKTQFGYEANQNCIAGRPFLDSISPVAVDPVNPYLGFKLNEVDAFLIPEEKFRQISSDEQIRVQPGPKFFVYLKSENITAEQMLSLTSALDLPEIARAVLNEHAEIFPTQKAGSTADVWKSPVYLKVPEETPFRLVGERLRIQLENAGFVISTRALPKNAPLLELAVREINEPDLDLFRYRLLRNDLQVSGESSWFEEWDDLEASGKIVPLLLYESRMAIRKNIVDVRTGMGGFPDFSEAWILPAP